MNAALQELSIRQLQKLAAKKADVSAEIKHEAATVLNRRLKEREMLDEWASWEWLFEDDIQRLEFRIQECYSGMKTAGVPKEMRETFVLNRLIELIRKVTNSENVVSP
jgi:hypothetical protein